LPIKALDDRLAGNTGNYGIQDQQAALFWVRQNISAFAGDPDRVTIFGESVGGLSVLYHLASPGSKDLFSRAIIQSGAGAIRKQPTLSEAETLGKNFANAVGCGNGPDPDVAACLRALPVLTILANQNVLSQPFILGPSANVDGVVLGQSVLEALSTGYFNRVPMIHGLNHDEGRFFIPLTPQLGMLHADGGFTDNLVPGQGTFPGAVSYTNALSALLLPGSPPNVVAQVVEKYPGGNTDASANAALAAVATDLAFACPAVTVDTLAALHGVAVYAYEFNDAAAPPNYFGLMTATIFLLRQRTPQRFNIFSRSPTPRLSVFTCPRSR
jgi:para-nitrobenzyl esterase